jgi:DNA-binding Xre family transcriptional regulator
MKDPDRCVNEAEAAEFLGVSKATLRIMRCTGPRPGRMEPVPFIRFGARCIRYSMADLVEYRDRHRTKTEPTKGESK